jgi:hypothetical protein
MSPPIKTTIEDIDALFGYLKGQVGWVPIDKIRRTIDSKYSDNRKLDACKYLGLIERDGTNVKLSDSGHKYARGDEATRAEMMRAAIRQTLLYFQTLEWIHHGKRNEPNKTDVGNYWHDNQQDELDGAKDSALTDAVVFFFRVADAADLGQFVSAGRGRPVTFLRVNLDAVAQFVTSTPPEVIEPHGVADGPGSEDSSGSGASESVSPPSPPAPPTRQIEVRTSPNVHVNVEIHIAADATPDTIAEIFKNMRKYVLDRAD